MEEPLNECLLQLGLDRLDRLDEEGLELLPGILHLADRGSFRSALAKFTGLDLDCIKASEQASKQLRLEN